MAIDARVVRTRIKLRESLLDLVADNRLEDITVAAIASHAGVGYATFFRHYPDKLALWHDIADGMTTEFLERLGILVESNDGTDVAAEICRFVAANWEVLRAIFAQGAEGAVREDLVRRSAELAGRRTRRTIEGLPRDLAMLHATSSTLGLMVWWMDHETEVSFDEMVAILDRLVIVPLRSERSPYASS